jgi:hypothetical protein
VCNVETPDWTSTPYVVVLQDIFEEKFIREAEETDGARDKQTLLKNIGHVGEDHEIDSKVAMKEKELVLNNGRRMLIK